MTIIAEFEHFENRFFLNYYLKQIIKIIKTCYMFQMNPKKFPHKTTFSVQVPYIAGHSL